MKAETCEQITVKLDAAIKERDRCLGWVGLRLGMMKQTADADREVRRLERRLARRRQERER